MKNKSFIFNAAVAAMFIAIFSLMSCEKDEGNLPDISFKTTAGYTYQDDSIAANGTFLVGINAAKTEDKDVLKTFNISKSVNGGASTTVQNVTLTSAQEDNYSEDFTLVAGGTPGNTEKYTFTITNRDGLTNTVSFTLTLN
jgi:hypothetical protein